MRRIAAWAIRNRAWVEVFIAVWLIGGIYSLFAVRKEFFPEISYDMIRVFTVMPGATAEDMERLVTAPLEDVVVDLSGVDDVFSTSMEGRSDLYIRVDPDEADLGVVMKDIERAIENVTDLPADAEDPEVVEMKSEGIVLVACILGDGPWETRKRLADRLEDRIRGLDGVTSIVVAGLRDREIEVGVDPAALAARNLGAADVAAAIRAADADLPAGRLQTGAGDYLVRTVGGLLSAEQLGEVVVRGGGEGIVRVKDVATVRETLSEEQTRSRVNGKPATVLTVFKAKEGDGVSIAHAIHDILDEERPKMPPGLELAAVQDFSELVEERLDVAWQNGLQGFILVFLLLAIFLDIPSAIWCSYGILSAILGGVAVLYMTGGTLNMLSIFGFILVLGMLDDDAITVVENVTRYREKGLGIMAAITRGAGEVARPLTASILTTAASLLALAMMSGIMGKFMAEIPKPGIFCLLATLAEALITIPIHLYLTASWGRPRWAAVPMAGWDRVRAWGDRVMDTLRYAHRAVLLRTLRHRYWFLLAVVVIFVVSVAAAGKLLRFVLVHTTDSPLFLIEVRAPAGTSFDEMERIMGQVEAKILELPPDEIESISSTIGSRRTQVLEFGRELGQIMVDLHEPDVRFRNADKIMDDLRPRLAGITGAEVILQPMEGGPPVGRPVSVRVSGDDWGQLNAFVEEMKVFAGTLRGVKDIEDDFKEGSAEVVVEPLPDALALAGANPQRLAQEVRAAVDGLEAASIRRGDEDVKVRVRYPEKYRTRIGDLRLVQVPTPSGPAGIGSLARLTSGQGLATVRHVNGKRTITLTADVSRDGVSSGEANAALADRFGREAQARGMSLTLAGEAEDTQKSMNSLVRSAAIALALIAMILVIQFQNFLQPLVILASLPLAIIGVVLTLIIHSYVYDATGIGLDAPMGLMPLIGLTALLGMVVNDAIVLVDFVNEARAGGANRWRSILQAGWQRLRPVTLASLTTAAGALPMAYTVRGSSSFLAPMALVFGWGIIVATLLTLLVTPNLLAIVDDWRVQHPHRHEDEGEGEE